MKQKMMINTITEYWKAFDKAPNYRVAVKSANGCVGWFFDLADDAQEMYDTLGWQLGDDETICLIQFNEDGTSDILLEGTNTDVYAITTTNKGEKSMKQKYVYVVNAGIVDSVDPNSGFEQTNEVARFTNLKVALECYNSIKRATDWSAPWGVTELLRYDANEKAKEDAEDSDYDADSTILRRFYQPQRGNNNKAFECK